MSAVESTQPCAVESTLWRECLKQFDYSPDKPRGACEVQRTQYYTCIKSWRDRQPAADEAKPSSASPASHRSYKNFEIATECGHEAEKLHQCMMMNAFEASKCQREMTYLKRCAAKYDKEVYRYLQDDPAIRNLNSSIDESTGLRRLWYKAIGKL